ncbi:MAG: hypothetical protein IT326_08855 [Anaerolineae bacterium]|nr:hypothetical protein [Anaerolineae bacterium]
MDRNYQPNLSPATAEQSPTSTYGPIITPCSGPELVFLAVDSNFRQGVYYDCTDSQNPILLLGEESEDVPRGWQIADFDVSVDGKTLAMAIIQGRSVSGRGRILLLDIQNRMPTFVYEEDLLLTDVFLLSDERLVGFLSSSAGYGDLRVINRETKSVSIILSGRDLSGGLPMSVRNVEADHDSPTRLLFQVSRQMAAGDPTLKQEAYVMEIDCVSEVCIKTSLSRLDWINDGAHSLSWSSGSSVFDVYNAPDESSGYLIIRDIDGNQMRSVLPAGFLWGDGISQPVSLEQDAEQIVVTYGIKDLLLIDLAGSTYRHVFNVPRLSGYLYGRARFCNLSSP